MILGYTTIRRLERTYGVRIDLKEVDSAIMEIIRRLEEENRRLAEKNEKLEKEKTAIDEERKDLEEENRGLRDENKALRKELEMKGIQVGELQLRAKSLAARVNLNSSNSSKPPSSDGYRKPSPKSLRIRSGRRRGGQHGHAGHSIGLPHGPDLAVAHLPSKCMNCHERDSCRSSGRLSCSDRRYVIDIVMGTRVTEHEVMRAARCPYGDACKASAPEDVKAHIQYGDSVNAVASLLNTYGAVSNSRISVLMGNMFGISLSPGSVVNMMERTSGRLREVLDSIRYRLIRSDVCHFDETGARTEGGLMWVHSSSNSEYTYQTVDPKRGRAGIDANGVLPRFKGTAVHDCWQPYFQYSGRHGLCNVHFLRELEWV